MIVLAVAIILFSLLYAIIEVCVSKYVSKKTGTEIDNVLMLTTTIGMSLFVLGSVIFMTWATKDLTTIITAVVLFGAYGLYKLCKKAQ